MARLTDEGLGAARAAMSLPRTLTYLFSDASAAYFGDPESREVIVWLDLIQWRHLGRPQHMDWNVFA